MQNLFAIWVDSLLSFFLCVSIFAHNSVVYVNCLCLAVNITHRHFLPYIEIFIYGPQFFLFHRTTNKHTKVIQAHEYFHAQLKTQKCLYTQTNTLSSLMA